MMDNDLTAFQASQLQFLKQQVDNLQEAKYRRDAPSNADMNLFAARQELETFVTNLRKGGKKI